MIAGSTKEAVATSCYSDPVLVGFWNCSICTSGNKVIKVWNVRPFLRGNGFRLDWQKEARENLTERTFGDITSGSVE